MILTVYNLNNTPLFTGTKQECKNYIKRENLDRTQIKIKSPQKSEAPGCNYVTAVPSEPKPKSLFKRLFNNE